MNKIKLWYYFCGIISLFIIHSIACKKKDTLTPTISVETTTNNKALQFTNNASTSSFKITANTSWTINNIKNNLSSTFYTLSVTSGTMNDSVVQVQVSKNPYPYTRYDTLFVVAGSSTFDTIFIQQDGVVASGTLLVTFNNLYRVSGKDSIVIADITLSDGTTYSNIPIDFTDNASFLSNDIPISSTTKIVAAIFKNQNGKIRNWWNWHEGVLLPAMININDAKYYVSGGNGTSTTPYIISNPAQLNNLRKTYHEGEFIEQDRDIDFADAIGLVKLNDTSFDFTKSDTLAVFYNNQAGWIPIGIDGSGGGLPFKGNYNANGKRIKNLYMNRVSTSSSSQITALFGVVTGNISDIIIDNTCLFLGTNSIGSIVGNLQGGNITNSANYGVVKGVQYVGGIVGSMNGGTIENSFNRGKIIAKNFTGGIVGGMYDNSTIKNCYNNADIKGNWWIGGLVGYSAGNSCTVSNSYNVGTLNMNTFNTNGIGGILGGMSKDFSAVSFQNCLYLQDGNINTNMNGVGGTTTISGITSKNTTELQGATNILDNTFWKDDNGQNGGFPILQWQ